MNRSIVAIHDVSNLVDLRSADDILLFANYGPEVAQIVDKFVRVVGKVGLRLNVDKTVILTNEAQPPNTLVTKDGLILKVLERNQGQRWLGCTIPCHFCSNSCRP